MHGQDYGAGHSRYREGAHSARRSWTSPNRQTLPSTRRGESEPLVWRAILPAHWRRRKEKSPRQTAQWPAATLWAQREPAQPEVPGETGADHLAGLARRYAAGLQVIQGGTCKPTGMRRE
jgi:hypothetical protein